MRGNGLFIELTESLAFGFVPLALLTDDNYRRDPRTGALVGLRHRRRLAVGTRLAVHVAAVDRQRRLVDFAPAR